MRKFLVLCLFLLLATSFCSADTLTGTWAFKTVIDATAAGEGIQEQELEVQIEQTGNKVLFSFGNATLKGTLNGNKLSVRGSYEQSGTVTKNLTFMVNGEEMKGDGEWTYSDGEGYTVKGTEQLEGVKLD